MTTSYTDVHPIKPSKKILRFNWFFWVFISIWSLSCYIKFALHISVCFSICSSIFVSLIFRASKELKESQRKHFLSLRMSPLISGSWNLRQYNKWAEIVSSAIKENIMSKGKCSLRVRAVCKSPHNHSPEIFPAFFFFFGCMAMSRPTLFDPVSELQPIRLLHPRDFQAKILEWVAISYSRGSSWPRNWTRVSLASPALEADSLPLSHQGSCYIWDRTLTSRTRDQTLGTCIGSAES